MKQLTVTNDIVLPKPLYDVISIDDYNPGNTDYSPSSMLLGPKEYWYKKKGKEDNTKLASRLWASATGKWMHKGIEEYIKMIDTSEQNYEYLTEQHYEVSWNDNVSEEYRLPEDRIIGGTIDLIVKFNDGSIILFDWKTMSSSQIIKDDKLKEWTIKANIYAWTLRAKGYKVLKASYIPIYKDWTITKALRDSTSPRTPSPKVTLELWPDEECIRTFYNYISNIEKYKDTTIEDIPYCSAEQRWEKEKLYKVCLLKNGKVGNALKHGTHNTMEEAELDREERQAKDSNKTYVVKTTGGESTKCKSWCDLSANGICDFNIKDM